MKGEVVLMVLSIIAALTMAGMGTVALVEKPTQETVESQ